MISIHAPLAGCDFVQIGGIFLIYEFQSTHPLRGATRAEEILRGSNRTFQSTHPLRGATETICCVLVSFGISIHAPLAGCDLDVRCISRTIPDFNPRTPCGVRLLSIIAPRAIWNFNPRTPCGVRQQNCRNIPGKFAQKLQNFCKAKQRAALPRVGQRESGCYFRPCAVRTSRGKPERFRFASDNERALRSVARLCAEVLDAGFILVSKVIKA